MSLKATLLGTGTSTGVPVVGCPCPVCTSDDPRNRRLRTGARIDLDGGTVLIDTPVDLRQQALRFGLPRVDAVLYTHAHADHVFGLDDLRIFNFRQGASIPCFGSRETLERIRRTFSYAFEGPAEGGGVPRIELEAVDGPFRVLDRTIVPVPVEHGSLEVYGYRIETFAYVTDCSRIPESSFELLAGVDVLVLDALRYRPHSTHFSLEEAVEAATRIGARRTVFTHLSHQVDAGDLELELPSGMELGRDGLVLEVE